MPSNESDFQFLKGYHMPDRIWYWYAANTGARDRQLLENHLLLCPVCQAQYQEVLCQLPVRA